MKDFVRRSSRVIRRTDENSKSTGRSRSRNASCEKPKQQRRKRKRTISGEPEPNKNNIPSESPVEVPKIQKKVIGGRIVDAFCWICHKLGDELICNLCPRVYHKDCLKKQKVDSFESSFCECKHSTVDRRNPHFVWCPAELKEMLQYAMQEAIKEEKKNSQKPQQAENSKFCRFFKTWPVIPENDLLHKIIDLDILIDKMNDTPPYQSTGHFFLDVKWMYHNCYIVYGADNEMTETAMKLEKKFKQELTDIEACRDCYENKHSDEYTHTNYFTRVCRKPHLIVWAKLRGSPFWPAKCLKIHNGHADVRFFGTHDKSVISVNHIYQISKVHPEGKDYNKMPKLKEAVDELYAYVSNYEKKIGPFQYFGKRIPVKETPSKNTKKHYKRGKHSSQAEETTEMNRLAEFPSPQSEVPNLLILKKENIDLKEAKVLIKKHKEPVETKVKATLHPPCDSVVNFSGRRNRNNTESLEDASDSTSNVVCQMTFTTDEDMYPNDMITDDYMNSSIPQFSVSENHTKTEIPLSPLNAPSDVCSETHLLPSCSGLVNSTKGAENLSNFTNDINASVPFPVITSARSTREDKDNSVHIPATSENSVIPGNLANLINDIITASTSEQESGTELSTDFESVGDVAAADDDDEIQVVKETRRNSLVESIIKTAPVTKTLCELLLANQPNMRDYLRWFQSVSVQFFLIMWLEVYSGRLETTELKKQHLLFVRLIKQVACLQEKISNLNEVVKNLKAELHEVTNKKIHKDLLRDEIIKASVNKLNHNKMDDYTDSVIKENKDLKEQLLKKDQIIESSKKETKKLKHILKKKDEGIARYEKKVKELMKIIHDSKHREEKNMAAENISNKNIPQVEDTLPVSSYQNQELSELNCSHSSVVLIQKSRCSGTNSNALSGTLVCETSITSECSFVTPQMVVPPPLIEVPVAVTPTSMMQTPSLSYSTSEIPCGLYIPGVPPESKISDNSFPSEKSSSSVEPAENNSSTELEDSNGSTEENSGSTEPKKSCDPTKALNLSTKLKESNFLSKPKIKNGSSQSKINSGSSHLKMTTSSSQPPKKPCSTQPKLSSGPSKLKISHTSKGDEPERSKTTKKRKND